MDIYIYLEKGLTAGMQSLPLQQVCLWSISNYEGWTGFFASSGMAYTSLPMRASE